MTDEEDDVERLEGQRLDDQEVGGPDRLSMVGKEGAPTLAGRPRLATPAVAADRARTDHDAELEELGRAPARRGYARCPRAGSRSPWWRSAPESQGSIGADPADGLSASASRAASLWCAESSSWVAAIMA